MALPVLRRHDHDAPETGTLSFEPWREFDELRERMDRLMQTVWDDQGLLGRAHGWAPPVDIEETDEAWIVEAELPGVVDDDVTVELSDTELKISGEVKQRERTGILRRVARRVGRFDYHVTLPGVSDREDVEATLERGLLTVTVPKPDDVRRRKIEVRSG